MTHEAEMVENDQSVIPAGSFAVVHNSLRRSDGMVTYGR